MFVPVDNRRESIGVLPFTVSLLDWNNGKLQLLATSPAQSFDAGRLHPGTFDRADVDTQRWQIRPKRHAIGVRMTYVRNTRTVRQVQEDLFLFLYDSKVVHRWSVSGTNAGYGCK